MKTSMVGLAVVAFLLLIVPVSGVLAWRTTGGYPRALDTSNSDCKYPAMYNIYCGAEIEVVTWQQWETDHWDIYFRYGSGNTWLPQNPYKITNNGVWSNNDNDNEHPDICALVDYEEPTDFTVWITWQYEHPDYGYTWEIEVCRIWINNVDTNWPGIINTVEYASLHQASVPYQDISVSAWDNFDSMYPAIDCGDNVYLVWEDYRNRSIPNVYFEWSLQGLTWQYNNGTEMQWSPGKAMDPCIAVDRDSDPTYDKICVLWEDYSNTDPNSQIYGRAAYLDAGSNWYYSSFQVQDGATLNNELNPDIEDFDGEFLYVWQDNRNGDWEIYYGKTAFNANPPISPQYWNTMRVTLDQNADENPAIDVCENDYDPQNVFNEIHICWDTDRTGVRDIYACRGVQSPGTTFDTLSSSGQGQSDNRVSFSNAIESYPDISCYSRDGYCVWQRYSAPWEIRYTIDP